MEIQPKYLNILYFKRMNQAYLTETHSRKQDPLNQLIEEAYVFRLNEPRVVK